MELFDLYTAERKKTDRKMIRGEPTPEGLYRLVVHVCIFDAQGRMLIQQRQPFKRGWSNLWDITVGGSAIAGDSSRFAAERETREELGLSLDLSGVRPSLTILASTASTVVGLISGWIVQISAFEIGTRLPSTVASIRAVFVILLP